MTRSIGQFIFYNNPDGYPPIINSARFFAEAGWSISILCRETRQPRVISYPPEVAISRIGNQNGSSWRQYIRFVRHVLEECDPQAAIIIGHDMHGLLPARFLATRLRRPLVYYCHDFTESGRSVPLGSRIVSLFERRFARTAQLVIVPDQERSQLMVRELKLAQDPLIVANAPRSSSYRESQALQNALAAQGKRFSRILFRQGRIGIGHAIEMTLRSMPAWRDRNWGFVIMGPSEEPYLQHIRRLAADLGVADRFVILPPVSYDEVGRFTVGADAGHALYEPIHANNRFITTASCKLMEYMAAGLPVLTSDRPGLRSLVERHGCGLTAVESDPGSIAVAVNALLADSDLANRMGSAAGQAFDQVYRFDLQFAPAFQAMRELSRIQA